MKEEHQTLTVRGHVRHQTFCSSETMYALPDPADPDQAVIQNVPFFVDGLNFGDVVRLGPRDDIGIRPIESVVIPSGCVRFLVVTGPLSESDLADHLTGLFPSHMVRVETGDGLLAVSVHPDLEPQEAVFEVFDWFEAKGVPPGDDSVGVSHLLESEVGPLGYPPWLP
jgi:Domain of unknown function (DUF4265)